MATQLALPPAAQVLDRTRQRNAIVVGAALYGLAALMIVAALIGAYLTFRAGVADWPPEGVKKQNYLGSVNVVAALLLLLIAEWIVWAVRSDERRQAAQATALAVLFELAMLNATITAMDRAGFGAGSHAYGTLFYAFFSVAALADLIGIAALVLHAAKLLGRQVSSAELQLTRAVSIAVHVSAITWLMTWCALYAASR
jgi:cytochrome c oxidase subunit 3